MKELTTTKIIIIVLIITLIGLIVKGLMWLSEMFKF